MEHAVTKVPFRGDWEDANLVRLSRGEYITRIVGALIESWH